MIEPQYVGVTYRQIAHLLRVKRGPGRERLISERPRKEIKGMPVYTDSPEQPTLVTFDEHCRVDVAMLLRTGAVVEWTAPAPKAAKRPEGKTPALPAAEGV